MHYKEKKRASTGKRIAVVLVLLVLVAGIATAAFWFINSSGSGILPGGTATPYVVSGTVKAMSVDMPTGEINEETLHSYFAEAATFARTNGFNTLVFNGKQGLSVYWRDTVFPTAATVTAQDSTFNKLDPLAILCEEANASGLQVWLSLDPYSSGNYTSEMKGKALALASAGSSSFSPADTAYEKVLLESLHALPKNYPIAGIVLSGLDASTQNATDPTAWTAAFTGTVGQIAAGLPGTSPQVSLALSFNETDGLLTAADAASLVQNGSVNYLLPGIAAGAGLSARLTTWADAAGGAAALVAVQPQGDSAGTVLFTAAASPAYAGAMLGSYQHLQALGGGLSLLTSTWDAAEPALPQGLAIPHALAVNYPGQNASTTSENLFIMGTSDPTQPLAMNGETIDSRGLGGAFGVLVNLTMGTNTFTFTQGDESVVVQITRNEAATGGGVAEYPHDATQEAQPGQWVRVTTQIASALTDYTDDGSINETFPTGASAVVQNSVETVRYNSETRRTERTWAYQLTSGDYFLAKNCEWVSGGASITGITAEADEKGEWLTLAGAGAPAAYVAYGSEPSTLNLTFYDTDLSQLEGFSSDMVQASSILPGEDGSLTLVLQMVPGSLWGYSLEYDGDATRLYLKRPPVLSDIPGKPLTGVTVLLDPGHGDQDLGAAGLMGDVGPNEKDLNLALAQSIAYRLRQLGATVTMIRDDDTFYTLEERLAAQTTQKPDFFLAVHHNALDPTRDLNDVAGMQAYYYGIYDAPPAGAFAQNLMSAMAAATGRSASEPKWGYYYVTRTTACPSVLFEYGFVTNPAEFEDLTSTDGIWAAACATAEGILASVPS